MCSFLEKSASDNFSLSMETRKFALLTNNIKSKLDTLMVSETKSDSTFPKNQSTAEGYVPPKIFDRNNRGGIMLYILEDSIMVAKNFLKKILFVELYLCKKKILALFVQSC